jgi:hypothetical protein
MSLCHSRRSLIIGNPYLEILKKNWRKENIHRWWKEKKKNKIAKRVSKWLSDFTQRSSFFRIWEARTQIYSIQKFWHSEYVTIVTTKGNERNSSISSIFSKLLFFFRLGSFFSSLSWPWIRLISFPASFSHLIHEKIEGGCFFNLIFFNKPFHYFFADIKRERDEGGLFISLSWGFFYRISRRWKRPF